MRKLFLLLIALAFMGSTWAQRTCGTATPEDVSFGVVGTTVWGYSQSGDCDNGGVGNWVASFTGEANAEYWFDLCDDGSADFDADIKIIDTDGSTILAGVDGSSGCSWHPDDFSWTCPANGTYYVVIAPYNSYGSWSCGGDASDTFTLAYYKVPAPACPDPTAQAESNITTTTADLSWTENGTATTWEIEYGVTGFAQGTGTTVSTTNNPYNLTGLTAATTYDWYVRADCGGGSYSDWVGPHTFSTLCNTIVAPYSEDFAGAAFPACWSQTSDLSNERWSVQNSTNAGGAANEMRNAWQSGTGVTRLISPVLDLTGLTTPTLTFKHFFDDYDAGITAKIQTSIDGGATWVDEAWSIASGSGNVGPETVALALTNTGANTLIAWVMDGNHYQFDYWYIDDVVVADPPSCPDPSGLTASNITTTTADLSWTENGSATSWDIELGATGFAPTGTPTQAGVTNPYTYTGLTASTTYDYYVRANCGGGSYSSWVGPYTFTTACNPLAIPYSQDFDAGVEWPSCWSESGDLNVFGVSTVLNGAGSSVYCSYGNQGHGYLYSPTFDATTNSNLHVRFFHYWRANWANEHQDGYFYGSPDGGTTQYLLGEWHHNNPGFTFGWNEYDISSWADGASDLVFWFDLDMGDDYYWVIDYFAVQEGAFGTHGLWTGATDNDWHTGSNWDDGIVPFSFSDVTIPTGLTNYPTVSSAGYFAYMDVASDATGDASILTNGNLTMTGGGSASVHRYITTDQWHLIGASTTGSTYGIFTDDWLARFDEPSNSYVYQTTVYDVMPWGEGYALYDKSGEGTDNNFTYTGDLFTTGTKSLTRSAPGQDHGWNLVANPYPSAIDWNAASGWTKTNVGGSIYLYNNGNWAVWNGTTGTNGATQYIPMGQGFFVSVVNDSTSGELGITYDAQVHSNQAFFKNEVSNVLKLTVSNEAGSDEMAVLFNEDATTAFDSQLDAYKLMNLDESKPNIYTVTDVKYSINTTPAVKSIPMNVEVANPSGSYTISVSENADFSNVVLEDTYTGEMTDLLAGDYTFDYVPGMDARFVLHFAPLSVEEDLADMTRIFAANHNINVSVPASVDARISVIDVLGQTVANVNAQSGMNVITVEEGTYIVRVLSAGNVVTQKVYVK